VQPGAQFPWHSHGPVFENLTLGELTYIEADGCAERRYVSGQAFVDPGQGHVHSAVNTGHRRPCSSRPSTTHRPMAVG
jgi:hypothetical protein